MRAVVYDRYGPPDVLRLEDVERPIPKEDEVLVKIHATAVTRADCATREANRRSGLAVTLLSRFISGLRRPKQRILGSELAGEVEAVGAAVNEFAVGDHVFGSSGFRFGAYAEFISMRESARIAHKPTGMSFEEAAAVCDGGLNALWCLRNAELRKEQRILIYGASGAIGTAGVQLAKYFEADVTAVCNTKNLEFVRSLGADRVIDYTQEDFTKNGQMYDVIFDAVGKHSFGRCKGSLKQGGSYLATDGLKNLILALWTSRIGDKKVIFKIPPRYTKKDVHFLKELIEAGRYRAVIDRCYPLEDVVEASRYVETEQKTGNVVLTIDGGKPLERSCDIKRSGNNVVQDLYREITQHLEAGETVAIATIVRRKGSVPREVGAKMLVQRGGKISGTVGGGCGEADVWRAALNVIDTRRPHTVQVDLTEEIAMESQGVCGGIFDVFIQPWHIASVTEQPGMLDIAQAISHALEGERAVALATIIAAGGEWRASVGQHMLVQENGESMGALSLPGASAELTTQLVRAAQTAIASGKPCVEHIEGLLPGETLAVAHRNEYHTDNTWAEIFVEPFVPPPVLLIAGAGHIAAPLAALAHLMNYSVSVTDDRASFASRERFPSAKQLLVGDIEASLRNYPITPRTHIVLVTRAHSHDVQGLRAIIDSPAAYIGMIGSQRRVWAVFKLLHDEGMPAEKLARVRAPIGLDLGGSTPEEIALCIMAEITMLHHGGTGQAMSESLRERFMERLKRMDEVM